MRSKSTGLMVIAMLAFLALPVVTFAQDRGWNNGRWQTEAQRRAELQRREEIRRQEAERRRNNDDRWDNNDRRDNNGRWDGDWNNRNRNGRNNDGYGNYGGSFQLRQTALNAGFADGAKEGRKDRSRGERFDFRDEGDYQKATRDYSSRLGDRELYRTYYRQAFDHGYRDGYAGY